MTSSSWRRAVPPRPTLTRTSNKHLWRDGRPRPSCSRVLHAPSTNIRDGHSSPSHKQGPPGTARPGGLFFRKKDCHLWLRRGGWPSFETADESPLKRLPQASWFSKPGHHWRRFQADGSRHPITIKDRYGPTLQPVLVSGCVPLNASPPFTTPGGQSPTTPSFARDNAALRQLHAEILLPTS